MSIDSDKSNHSWLNPGEMEHWKQQGVDHLAGVRDGARLFARSHWDLFERRNLDVYPTYGNTIE